MSILGTPVNFAATPTQALTWTLESGTTAVIIVVEHEQTALSELIDGITMGSVSATFFGSNTAGGSGSARPLVEVWRITADLNSIGTNPTITITPDTNGSGDYYGTIYCVDGIDTNTANWSSAEDSDNTVNALQITLTTVADSLVIGGASCTVQGSSFTTTVGGVDVETTGSDRNLGTASRVVSFSRVATGSSVVVDCDNGNSNTGNYQAMYAVSIPPGSTTPSITSTSDDTPTNGTTLTINGSNFGTQTGSAGVTLGGTSVTPSSWSTTAIQIPITLGSRLYNQNYAIVVTDSSNVTSNSWNVQIQPASGVNYVNLSGTLASSGDRLTATTDLASGDQVEWSSVVGGTIADVTVNADASFTAIDDVTSFSFRVNDGTGWGTSATQDLTLDVTAPTFSSATVGTNGTTITIVFSEAVTFGAGGNGGLSLDATGGAASLTYSSGSGSDTLVYTASRTIKSTESFVDLTYTQPGNGIEDLAGNDLASFSGAPVTNNSTQNAAPTDISLSLNTIPETAGANAVVGQLSATDVDPGETFTYSLVAGAGDTNNASFNISGTSLRCNDPAALGPGTYSVRVRVTDSASNTYDEAFSVTVSDVLDERINYITTTTGTDSTAAITCEVGDILIAWAARDGSVTTPTMPAGWTNIISGGANTLGYRLAYKTAASTSEASGTWTGATSIAIVQYRPGAGYTLEIGASATGLNSSGTNAIYPALTLQDTSGYSSVVCGYAHRSADITPSDATAAGLTSRVFVQDATDTLAVHTAERVSSFSGTTVTYTGTSSSRRYVSVEVKAVAPSSVTRFKPVLSSVLRNIVKTIRG